MIGTGTSVVTTDREGEGASRGRALAFLDLGGTLLGGDPVMLWAEERRREGILPERTYARLRTLTAAYH